MSAGLLEDLSTCLLVLSQQESWKKTTARRTNSPSVLSRGRGGLGFFRLSISDLLVVLPRRLVWHSWQDSSVELLDCNSTSNSASLAGSLYLSTSTCVITRCNFSGDTVRPGQHHHALQDTSRSVCWDALAEGSAGRMVPLACAMRHACGMSRAYDVKLLLRGLCCDTPLRAVASHSMASA